MTRRLILSLILAGYFILGALFAAKTPAWQAPDEPAHYNYIAYLAEKGDFPVLHFGDYPHAYLEQIKAARFPPGMPVTPIRYESHQPPLYYGLAAPVYSLAGGSLTALRLLSVLLGAGIVVLAYGVARRVLPGRPAPALGAAAFVAFLPQHLATVSQVGNDVLAELLLAAVLFLLVGLVSEPGGLAPETAHLPHRGEGAHAAVTRAELPRERSAAQTPLVLGVLLGLILITKTTAYIAVPLALGVLVWRWLVDRAPARRILLEGLSILLPAAAIALPWYVRNIVVYGWPDFLGLIRHDQIVTGQMRTLQYVAEHGWAAYWGRAAEWTFKSFAGVFGWMGVWLDSRVYYVLGLWLGIPAVAWAMPAAGIPALATAQRTRADRIGQAQGETGGPAAASQPAADPLPAAAPSQATSRSAAALLVVSALLTLLAYVYYNVTFLQHQGRYLFTALIPIAIFLAAGWERALTPRTATIVAGVLLAGAAALAAWGVWLAPPPAAGIPKWPLLLTAAAAVGLVVAGRLAGQWRRWAYAAAYALLPAASFYALFGAIIPQLTR